MSTVRIDLPKEKIADFCRRWKVAELALFGSVLRDDFYPDSDIDVLVTFGQGERWGLSDLVNMKEEIEQIFGRSVDFIEKRAIERSENPFRRKRILSTMEPIYVG